MTDSTQSTPIPLSPRFRPAHRDADKVRQDLLSLAADFEELDHELERLASTLPEATQTFDLLAELGEAARCVRLDLLADAIATLRHAATATEPELRRDFEERR